MNDAKQVKPSILPRKRNLPTSGVTGKAEKVILDHKNRADVKIETRDEKIESEIKQTQTQTQTQEQTTAKTDRAESVRLAKEIDKIFQGDNFKGLIRAPADLMLAASGRKIWDIPDKEIQPAADLGAIAARTFVKTDAKWLSLILFSMSLVTLYGGRSALHYREVQKERVSKLRKVKGE